MAWILIFKFICLTIVTYFVMSSAGTEGSHFEDVNEALGSSALALMALCAAGFVLLSRLFRPYNSNASEELFTPQRLETHFLPGFLHGAVLAAGVTLAFILSGTYRYLGFFIQADRAPLALAGLLIRICSILALVYCEEFIFRHQILKSLVRRGGLLLQGSRSSAAAEFFHRVAAVTFTGVLYVAIKFIQFDLSWMQALTLFLVSLALGTRTLARGDFILAAGFWSALLIVFHTLVSLPVLGQEFSGLLLIKYQALASEPNTEFWAPQSTYGETLRFITGGAGGPLPASLFNFF